MNPVDVDMTQCVTQEGASLISRNEILIDGTNSEATVPVEAIGLLLKSVGYPAAVVHESGRLVELTEQFAALFPGIGVDSELDDLTDFSQCEVFAALQALVSVATTPGNPSERSSATETTLHSSQITVVPIGERHYVLHVDTQRQRDDQLHEYMQARDLMFSTSRAITVSEMAATLAHEINTPISTISNLLQGIRTRLQRTEQASPEILKALASAEEQALFTSSIVYRIRDFTQARQPQKKPLDLRTLVIEAQSILDWYFTLKRCKVRIQLPAENIVVEGDSVMLQQVFLNLLKNAADAMHTIPTDCRWIDISCVLNGRRMQLKVRDYGPGLEGAGDSLFMPFVTQKEQGMGIGLNICRSFLELHRGRLWLSDAEGAGCCAVVELPLMENPVT